MGVRGCASSTILLDSSRRVPLVVGAGGLALPSKGDVPFTDRRLFGASGTGLLVLVS